MYPSPLFLASLLSSSRFDGFLVWVQSSSLEIFSMKCGSELCADLSVTFILAFCKWVFTSFVVTACFRDQKKSFPADCLRSSLNVFFYSFVFLDIHPTSQDLQFSGHWAITTALAFTTFLTHCGDVVLSPLNFSKHLYSLSDILCHRSLQDVLVWLQSGFLWLPKYCHSRISYCKSFTHDLSALFCLHFLT